MSRKNSFDPVRLVAAIAVLLSHSFPLSGQNAREPLAEFTRYGSIGGIAVDVFFVISGYLIAGSYHRSTGALEFLAKRFLRLFPALLCAVLFSVLVLGPILSPLPAREYFTHPQTIEYLRNLFLDIHYVLPLVFASNPYPNVVNGSLWTLPLEAFMYVLVMLAGMTKCLTGRGCAVVALAFAWLHFAVPSTAFTDNGVVLHVMLYSELTRLGVLYFIGAAFVFAPARWIENKEAAWFAVGMLALFAESPIAELIATVTLPIIVLTIASRPSRVSVALGKVGDLSYGVYVYAFPIQQIAALLLGARVSPASVILLSLPATLILSFASWHLIEKKALRLKNVLGRRAALATGAQ